MKRLLALDPGITTGFAILSMEGTLLESGNWVIGDLTWPLPAIETLSRDKELIVVQEQVPTPTQGQLDQNLFEILGLLRLYFGESEVVRPTEWKSLPPIYNYPFPTGQFQVSTVHQRDAFRVGIYYLIHRLHVGLTEMAHD